MVVHMEIESGLKEGASWRAITTRTEQQERKARTSADVTSTALDKEMAVRL
jgi:hypothetical protein